MKYYLISLAIVATLLIMVVLFYKPKQIVHVPKTDEPFVEVYDLDSNYYNQEFPLQPSYSEDTSYREVIYGTKSKNTAIGINHFINVTKGESDTQKIHNNNLGAYEPIYKFEYKDIQGLYDSFGNKIPQRHEEEYQNFKRKKVGKSHNIKLKK